LKRGHPKIVVHGVRLADVISSQSGEAKWQEEMFNPGGIERMWMSHSSFVLARSSLIERLMILQYSGLFPEFLKVLREGKKVATMRTDARRQDDGRGFMALRETLAEKLQKEKRVKGSSQYGPRGDEKSYTRGKAKIKEIKKICDNSGALYVLINIPEHPNMYGKEGAGLYSRYVNWIRDFSLEKDFRFVDPSNGDPRWINSDVLFADYRHLTFEGAELLTRKLAIDVFEGWDEGYESLRRK